ncbi:MAG: pilus assembly protein TadG-related protein [Gemmata sp.]
MKTRTTISPRRRGSTLPLVTVLLVMLVGMVSFAIDTGRVAHGRTGLQAAADAGALAGVCSLVTGTGPHQDVALARSEVREFVGDANSGNFPGLVVPDADIVVGYFDSKAGRGTRFKAATQADLTKLANGTGTALNAVQVTLRRDGTNNARLPLAFSSLLGKSNGDITARATAWVGGIGGFREGSMVIPYVAQIDYFNAACGLPERSKSDPGYVKVDPTTFTDSYSVGQVGSTLSPGQDGIKEIVLFSNNQTANGNFGIVNLGAGGASDISRQLLYGPNAADFAILASQGVLAPDGSLQAPVTLSGDSGINNGTQSSWQAIIGQNRIIPLYSQVRGSGTNAMYDIVGFAGIRVISAQFNGNKKQVIVQTISVYSNRVTPAGFGSSTPSIYSFSPPQLAIP